MQIVSQEIEDILGSLRRFEVDWKDETASHVIARLRALPVKATYTTQDMQALWDANFDEGTLICRLFMGHGHRSESQGALDRRVGGTVEKRDLRQLGSEAGL